MTARKFPVLNNMQLIDICKFIPEVCQKIASVVENRDDHSTAIELQSNDRVDPEVSIPSWHVLLTQYADEAPSPPVKILPEYCLIVDISVPFLELQHTSDDFSFGHTRKRRSNWK
jgi:hypothetical protein